MVTREGCTKKVTYYNRNYAKQAAKRRSATMGGRPVEAFRCDWCNYWRIGHRDPRIGRSA